MPIISTFFGIIIKIHYQDHNPPHFHAEYQGQQAIFAIKNARIIEGDFPKKLIPVIKEWTLEHKIELLDDWERAQKNEPLLKISGADS